MSHSERQSACLPSSYTCGVLEIVHLPRLQYYHTIFRDDFSTYLAICLIFGQANEYDSKLASSVFSVVAQFGLEQDDLKILPPAQYLRLCDHIFVRFLCIFVASILVELLAELNGSCLCHLGRSYHCIRLLPSLQDVYFQMISQLLLFRVFRKWNDLYCTK